MLGYDIFRFVVEEEVQLVPISGTIHFVALAIDTAIWAKVTLHSVLAGIAVARLGLRTRILLFLHVAQP